MKIKKGDKVLITTGKDRGKTGKVERVVPKKEAVIVSGMNIIKKHLRPTRNQPKGGIVEQAAPINISNVKLICSKCQKPARVGYKKISGEKKRICKKCQEVI
jgi:large subunit ribosomal protein L24